jgi:single-strand DNA-binding protein
MNKVIMSGNITSDPELKYLASGIAVANFTVASNRRFKKADGTYDSESTFVQCEVWDTAAENIAKIMVKGDPILIEGALKQDSWEKDGQKFSRLKVRLTNFEKLNRAPAKQKEEQQDTTTNEKTTPDDNTDDEHIPF